MTEQKHTPEPWRIGAMESGQAAIDAANGSEVTGWLDHDDARRIVACVNACAGIDTEDLERHYNAGGGIDSAMEEAALRDHVKVWQQRDQLRAALEGLREYVYARFGQGDEPEMRKVIEKARAALAATEGA